MARPTLLEQKEKHELTVRKPGRPPTTTKSAVLALQHKALSKIGPAVFARLEEAVNDKTDPFHAKAMELLIDRIAPKAYWNAVAEKEVGTEGAARPSISIVINSPQIAVEEVLQIEAKELDELDN